MRDWVKPGSGLSIIRDVRHSPRCWRRFKPSGICRCNYLPVDTASHLRWFEHSPILHRLFSRSFRWEWITVSGSTTLNTVHIPYISIRTTPRKRILVQFSGKLCA